MFSIFVFLVGIFGLSFALNGINKKSGEVLDNLTWTNISSLADKIDVSSSDIKLNGKLYVTGELCSVIGGEKKCLGSCENNFHWDNSSFSCKPNNCTAQEFISNTYKYNVPELNNGATSAVLTSTNYEDIANGKKYYTRGFACINGVIEVSGSEGSSLNCDIGYTASGDNCVANNCLATNISGYSISSLTHGQTKTFIRTVSISNGINTYSQAFNCNLGTVYVSGGQSISTSCHSGYTKSGTSCVATRDCKWGTNYRYFLEVKWYYVRNCDYRTTSCYFGGTSTRGEAITKNGYTYKMGTRMVSGGNGRQVCRKKL